MGGRFLCGALLACGLVQPTLAITFEERVAAQRAVEEVYWNHRLWPKENPGPKPPLSAVIPDAAIRARVEGYLKESIALERFWQRPITTEQLQAELDRMTSRSHDPAMLRELFAALGNDPNLVAETLARPSLADRLVRSWYAGDDRFHGELSARARRARASCTSPACMRSMGGRYIELTSKDATDARPIGELGPLEVAADAFSVSAVIARRGENVTIASVVWEKTPFEEWWGSAARGIEPALDAPGGSYALAAPATGSCTEDTWQETFQGLEARNNLSAVWTGAEMIVWGGADGTLPLNSGGRYNPATDTWLTTSRGAYCPSPRYGHTSVWTGTEMIVWGGGIAGSNPADVTNTGGRYDPSTDSWSPMSTSTARRAHTAVWTGTRMIVWGGTINSSQVNTGGIYDPATNVWLNTATFGAPPARYFHTAVWTGSRMVVWGGYNNPGPVPSGGRYDPVTDTWQAVATTGAPPPTYGHVAVWTGSKMIVWGGAGSPPGPVNTGGRYDPSANSWQPMSTALGVPEARNGHSGVWTGSQLIVWGGSGNSGSLDTGGRYDPVADTWTSTSTHQGNPLPRLLHAAVWTGSEMIVWGGQTGTTQFASGGRYAPSTDSWVPTSLPPTGEPAARAYHTSVWTGAEMIVWGGMFTGGRALNSGARYLPATDSWLPTAGNGPAPAARFSHTAVWTGTRMIVWGGEDEIGFLNSGGRYNPAQDQWQATTSNGPVPTPRSQHVAVWDGTEMIIWGGANGLALNDGGRYAPGTNSWTATATSGAPTPRWNATGVWTGSELLIWGGAADLVWFNSGGRYRPADDTWTPTSQGPQVPQAREFHLAVWTGDRMIVWGGILGETGLDTNTGGVYDPGANTWAPTSLLDAPSPRSGHVIVWTGNEMIVWGGSTSTGGRYNPSQDSWFPTSTLGSPVAHSAATAVWMGSEMIVWGGAIGFTPLGLPLVSASGGRYCAELCATPSTLYRDVDGDGYGNPNVTHLSCATPPGWIASAGDCNDADPLAYPGAAERCNQRDDDCDGVFDEDALGEDTDGDEVRNACDNCVTTFNPSQSNLDFDGVGDMCDLDDGVIYVFGGDKTHIAWQGELLPTSWNVYEGDLAELRASGIYTQVPGSNALANRRCAVTTLVVDDTADVPLGAAKFTLVTGQTAFGEMSLGTTSRGVVRLNTNPCP